MTYNIVEKLGEVTTYSGATAAAVFWGLQISDVGVIVSTLIAVLGFGVHVWAHIRRERRDQERHRLVMEMMKSGTAQIDVGASQGDIKSDQ
jgi:hypothetical protein